MTTTPESYRRLLDCMLALMEDIEDSTTFDELRARVRKTNEVIALERIPTLAKEPDEC